MMALPDLLALALSGVAAALLVPCAVLALEVVMARRSPAPRAGGEPRGAAARACRPAVAVVVPAHDEALGIAATLSSVRAQLDEGDTLLVVADNCADDTAEVARAAGARVSERVDPRHRGKGYALEHGLRELRAVPHEVLLMVDADCQLGPGCVDALVRAVQDTGLPAQARYLMLAEPGAGVDRRVAEFAWRVKNGLRPLGANRLGWPCLLTGSGMAFPRASLDGVPLASGNIVEDMQLGLDLALRGLPPRHVPQALVTSRFALGDGARAQRTRWEHGHLATQLTQVPRLVAGALRRRDPRLLGLALELCVPPLALLALLSATLLCAALALAVFAGRPWPLVLSSAGCALLLIAVVAAWRAEGRDLLSARDLLQVSGYALHKLPLYLRFLRGRQAHWVRARRDGE